MLCPAQLILLDFIIITMPTEDRLS